eukprot:m.124692 g.124692  ORF g.124692 m.124692 type:complete len:210 (-) comp16300_c2_seq1:1521-2150(-)
MKATAVIFLVLSIAALGQCDGAKGIVTFDVPLTISAEPYETLGKLVEAFYSSGVPRSVQLMVTTTATGARVAVRDEVAAATIRDLLARGVITQQLVDAQTRSRRSIASRPLRDAAPEVLSRDSRVHSFNLNNGAAEEEEGENSSSDAGAVHFAAQEVVEKMEDAGDKSLTLSQKGLVFGFSAGALVLVVSGVAMLHRRKAEAEAATLPR